MVDNSNVIVTLNGELKTEEIEIVSIVILCKLSDGTVRSVNTGRKQESKILDLLEKEYGTIPISYEKIGGDIIIPL